MSIDATVKQLQDLRQARSVRSFRSYAPLPQVPPRRLGGQAVDRRCPQSASRQTTYGKSSIEITNHRCPKKLSHPLMCRYKESHPESDDAFPNIDELMQDLDRFEL